MRVHHINCATMCPLGGRLVYGDGAPWTASRMVCHCLLVETEAGLVLVDTGLGLADMADPRGRLGSPFLALTRPRLDPAATAARQIAALGFSIDDVRHVVPTHLDVDHAGGLPDFPRARVHVLAREHAAAMARVTQIERMRYHPEQWAHGPTWVLHAPAGEPWFGFECVRELEGIGPDVLLVPLLGHTRGHAAVAVRTAEGWLLHAGDAYFHRHEVDVDSPRCTPALAAFQKIVAIDDGARRANQARLRELRRSHADEVRIFCAHDPHELESLRAASGRHEEPTSGRTKAPDARLNTNR